VDRHERRIFSERASPTKNVDMQKMRSLLSNGHHLRDAAGIIPICFCCASSKAKHASALPRERVRSTIHNEHGPVSS
jgi:hypothetical protein